MRLLMVTQDFPPQVGGIQTYSAELAARLARRCSRFEVVAPRDPGWETFDQTVDYHIHRLPLGADGMRLTTLGAVPKVARRGFDALLHAQWYTAHSGIVARRLGLVEGVFVAAHGRELLLNEPAGWSEATGRAFSALRRTVFARVDRFFPVSHYTGDLLVDQGVPSENIDVIPNGVDPMRRRPEDGDEWREAHDLAGVPLLLTLARLVPRKGIDTVIRSLPKIAAALPEVTYVVAGSGPDRERLEALAREVGVEARVRFVGHVPEEDLNPCLSAANVFVMPARSDPPDVEGFGLAFLEANACGRPVVGARAGGVPDAIVPGETGELVEPDDAEALAETLIELLRDPRRADTMGERGRERVMAECSWEHVADRMFESMEAALG